MGIELGGGGVLFADGFESGDTSVWGSPDPHFFATRVLDLVIETRFAGDLEGDHLLRLRLTTPKGHHYQTLTLPIAFETSQRETARRDRLEPALRPMEGRGHHRRRHRAVRRRGLLSAPVRRQA